MRPVLRKIFGPLTRWWSSQEPHPGLVHFKWLGSITQRHSGATGISPATTTNVTVLGSIHVMEKGTDHHELPLHMGSHRSNQINGEFDVSYVRSYGQQAYI